MELPQIVIVSGLGKVPTINTDTMHTIDKPWPDLDEYMYTHTNTHTLTGNSLDTTSKADFK